ncbi:MAG: ArnT family glycosyltransferase [Rhodospirillales bacterium]|jgi:4-amino-4-deoxy-L-arabinose transferase-like glycosyltransferase
MNERRENGSASSKLQRLLTANVNLTSTPCRFYGLIFLFLLALLTFKSAMFAGIGGDEGEQLIFAQYFDWGYVVRNPPLFTWLVIAAQSVFGVNAFAVNAVKLVVLFLLYGFMYKAALLILTKHRLAVLAALSPLLIFHIAWDSLLGFSHSVMVAMVYAATFFAAFNLEKNNRLISYAGFGVAIGCGFLSKYAFAFFLIALLAACLFDAKLRGRILNKNIVVTIMIAAAIVTPHFIWLYDRHAAMAGELAPALQAQGTAEHLFAAGKGTLSGIKAIVGFLLPLLAFLALFFPAAWRPKLPATDPEQRRLHRTLTVFFAVLIGIIFLFIMFGGITRVRTHYMFVMVLFPLLFFLRVQMAAPAQKRLDSYAGILTAAAVIVLLGLPIKYFAEPWRCGKCEHHMPYVALAQDIRTAGFKTGTIFAYWHPYPIAGNMRLAFPEARVISAKHTMAMPPLRPSKTPSQCLLIWSGPAQGAQANNTIRLAREYLGLSLEHADAAKAAKSVQASLSTGTKKTFELGYIFLSPGKGDCR